MHPIENTGYPTPPLSVSGRHSPKPSDASQLPRTSHSHQSPEKSYFPPYDPDTRSHPSSPSYTKPYYPSSSGPTHRSPRSRSGSPILHRVPSPYNASRARPRKGFVKRMLGKFREWMRNLVRFARRNPIKAGLMSLLPVVAVGGMVKGLVSAGKGVMRFFDEDEREGKKGEDESSSGAKERDPGDFGIFDQFSKFGGSKAGPLDGILKIVQMFVNHYCRLSKSDALRTASIILELYFLEKKKL